MRPTRHRFTIPPEIQGRIAGGDLRLLVSSGLPVLEDAAPFSPISDPKIVGQFLLLCGSPRVMQLGLNRGGGGHLALGAAVLRELLAQPVRRFHYRLRRGAAL